MTIPLIILAVLSILTGYLGIPQFLAPVLPRPEGMAVPHADPAAVGIMLLATLMGLGGIATAYLAYVKSPGLPQQLAEQWRNIYALSLNKWYVDELYDRTVVQPTVALANRLWKMVDMAVIDGMVNGVGGATVLWGRALRLLQSGELGMYLLLLL